MHRFASRPSPALVISLIALFVAIGGSAYAVSSLSKNSVGSKQIKKRAIKGIDVKKNALTGTEIKESKLGKVPSAKSSDSATTATTAGSAQPVAFVEISSGGVVDPAHSKGVAQSNVTDPGTGVFCISGLSFPIKGAAVTPSFGGTFGTTANYTDGPTGFCPNGGQVTTYTTGGAPAPADLAVHVLLYG